MSFKFLAKIGNIFITRKCLLSFFEITKFGYNWNKKTAPKRSGSLLCLACVIYVRCYVLHEKFTVLFQSNFLRRLFI